MVKMGMLVLPMLVLSCSLIIGGANAWGREGHFMICKIAQEKMTPKTQTAVSKLLAPVTAGGDLASVCSWADATDIRSRYPWSRPLHYANIRGTSCDFDYSRDCRNSNGKKDMCVAGAIHNYTAQLQTYRVSPNRYNLTESLMFLSHFVGDIHQPLHVGFEADRGGIDITVYWYVQTYMTDLHRVWDTLMIRETMRRYYGGDPDSMRHDIQNQITSSQIDLWEECSGTLPNCVNEYASESIDLACSSAYKLPYDKILADPYVTTNITVVMKRIAQAGVRLADILNKIFDGSSSEGKLSSY